MKRGKEYEMKNYTTLTFIVFLALVLRMYAQQTATPEPYSIKTDKLGEIAADWLANDPTHKDWKCTDMSHVVEGEPITCSWERSLDPKVEAVTYAGLELQSQSASFVGKDSKLVLYQVQLKFCNGDGYEATLVSAFNEKFGILSPPLGGNRISHTVTPLQNGFGATDLWMWTNDVSTVTLYYTTPEPTYHSPLVTFTLDSLVREIQERQHKAAQKKARSDM
jgi:hypothetical protein